jgi:hypothetical protein
MRFAELGALGASRQATAFGDAAGDRGQPERQRGSVSVKQTPVASLRTEIAPPIFAR